MAKSPKRRPPSHRSGTPAPLESRVAAVGEALAGRLALAQLACRDDLMRFSSAELESLALVLVEFAADLHAGLGAWAAVEAFHERTFGTPLPFVSPAGTQLPAGQITPERVRFFLWGLLGQINPDFEFQVRPDHPDLLRLADVAARVLRDRFAGLTRHSALKDFLDQPIQYGWDVKEKLIWLGRDSYLFRDAQEAYLEDHLPDGPLTLVEKIPYVDDFLNQESTGWAGLGVVDVLAGILPLSPERRADLLEWPQRHQAVFQVLAVAGDTIRVLNLINDQEYPVRLHVAPNPFKVGLVLSGGLVPWDGEWYWSGTQQVIPKFTKKDREGIKAKFRTLTQFYYRYQPDDLALARRMTRRLYDRFVARHGKDWTTHADGRALAADWQADNAQALAEASPAQQQASRKKYGRKGPPPVPVPAMLAATPTPIGVYFNPDEGQELVNDFDVVLAGFARRGAGLTEVEAEAIRSLVTSPNISPGFVRRLADEFGPESVAAAFGLADPPRDYTLEYLLRRFKGAFFRPRYPTLTLLDD